jgi:putative alpha-1,2-mannosidase
MAHHDSLQNHFSQSAKLNGSRNRAWINPAEIASGDTLELC